MKIVTWGLLYLPHTPYMKKHTLQQKLYIFSLWLLTYKQKFSPTLPALCQLFLLLATWVLSDWEFCTKITYQFICLIKKKKRERKDLLALYRDGRWKVGDPTPWTSVILKIIPPPSKYKYMNIFFLSGEGGVYLHFQNQTVYALS